MARYYSKRRKAYFSKQLKQAKARCPVSVVKMAEFIRSPWGYWVPRVSVHVFCAAPVSSVPVEVTLAF